MPAPSLNVWLDGTRDWLLGSTVAESPVARSGLSLATYGLITLVAVLVSIGLTIWRYRRLGT